MRYLRILHNGDLREGTPQPSPHWMVHVREDGEVWGEVLTPKRGCFLPEGFRLADAGRFFDIPEELQQHRIQKQPDSEEIILSLQESSGRSVCSFLKSQLSESCSLRRALDQLVQKIQEITEPGAAPNGGPAPPLGNSGASEGPPSVS